MHLTRCKIDLYDCLYLYTIKTAVDWCRNGQSSKLAISDRRSGSDPQILGPWSDEEMQKLYDSGVEQLRNGPAARNYEAYSEVLGDARGPATLETWTNATARHDTWLQDRLTWMDLALGDPKLDYSS